MCASLLGREKRKRRRRRRRRRRCGRECLGKEREKENGINIIAHRCHISSWKDALQMLHHRPSQFHCRRWLTSLSDLTNHGSKQLGLWLVRLIRRPPWRTNQKTWNCGCLSGSGAGPLTPA
ncbi:hypothetical protein JOB18_040261 [Solea senegalensis]|uniref:Uncharacterized protein n=1 Tax=Solea senegalensis TaxID=28829 RepID=A0AAV6S7H2_SOLSE|nr:hypothetical protein JOB18_040261 [Solea senegalensis]